MTRQFRIALKARGLAGSMMQKYDICMKYPNFLKKNFRVISGQSSCSI